MLSRAELARLTSLQGYGEPLESELELEQMLDTVKEASDAWGQLPKDVQGQILSILRQVWEMRDEGIWPVIYWVAGQVLWSGLPVAVAVRQAGIRFNLRPRTARPRGAPIADVRVRQYHRRQQQRGRRPGRASPRSRRLRELEAEHPFSG